MIRACCHRRSIEPRRPGKKTPQLGPFEAGVAIRGIIDRADPGSRDDACQIVLAPSQKRAEQGAARPPRHNRNGAHRRKAANASPAIEPHQQGFSLIVSMMRGCNGLDALRLRPIAERGIARGARALLQGRTCGQIECQSGVGYAAPCADCSNNCRFGGALPAQTMIDGCDHNWARCGNHSQKEQGKTIRPT